MPDSALKSIHLNHLVLSAHFKDEENEALETFKNLSKEIQLVNRRSVISTRPV